MRGSFLADVDRALIASESAREPERRVLDSDLDHLPPTVRRYLHVAGVVGRPRVVNMHATMHGRIRSSVTASWMPFVVDQFSFFKPPARFFFMKASRWLIPVHVYHRYVGPDATMEVKLLDQLPVTSASGLEMTKAETVTMFNDMCVLAPATLIDPDITWSPMDARHAVATFSNGGHTITAELFFNDAGELIDFRSGDRLRTEPDGSMKPMVWSTPMHDYRDFGGARLGSRGAAMWHEPGGPFAYVELTIDEVAYNISHR